jgi:hypothetical protein
VGETQSAAYTFCCLQLQTSTVFVSTGIADEYLQPQSPFTLSHAPTTLVKVTAVLKKSSAHW